MLEGVVDTRDGLDLTKRASCVGAVAMLDFKAYVGIGAAVIFAAIVYFFGWKPALLTLGVACCALASIYLLATGIEWWKSISEPINNKLGNPNLVITFQNQLGTVLVTVVLGGVVMSMGFLGGFQIGVSYGLFSLAALMLVVRLVKKRNNLSDLLGVSYFNVNKEITVNWWAVAVMALMVGRLTLIQIGLSI